MTIQGASGGAGGNLAHNQSNLPAQKWDELLEFTRQLATIHGQSEDTQIKHLLGVTQAAFEGVIDNTVDKHGAGVDDATKITETYWAARNKQVIFNPKAGNQRKTISCIRQCIRLGGWSKGGPGEPLGMVNMAMSEYRTMRKDLNLAKKLMDAANYLIKVAREMKRRDQILDRDELRDMAFKKESDLPTVEDVLDAARHTLKKLHEGKHRAGACSTANVENAIKALNKELKGIADAKRQVGNAQAAADAAVDISQAADKLPTRVVGEAGVAAPESASA